VQKRNLLVAGMTGLVVAGSLTFGATANAAPAPAPVVLKACVTDSTGAIKMVSARTTSCARGQRLVTWNQAGVAGPRGATGATGARGATGPAGGRGPAGLIGPAGPAGPAGAIGPVGPAGPAGAIGPVGPAGPAGAIGPVGPAGPDGTRTFTGEGPATDEIKADAREGDFYLDRTTGAVSLSVFDGEEFVDPVLLSGAAGAKGETGGVGPQGLTGDRGGIGPEGPQGPKGESVVVKRESAATPTVDTTAFTVTLECQDGETAIGAGYTGASGISLVGSDAGTDTTDWVLTFDGDPSAVTGTVLCTAIS
jgi:hypothetical protein